MKNALPFALKALGLILLLPLFQGAFAVPHTANTYWIILPTDVSIRYPDHPFSLKTRPTASTLSVEISARYPRLGGELKDSPDFLSDPNTIDIRLTASIEGIVDSASLRTIYLRELKGVARLNDGNATWTLGLSQENWGTSQAVLQTSLEQNMIRVVFPLMLFHKKSGIKVHTQFEGGVSMSDGGKFLDTGLGFALTRTRDLGIQTPHSLKDVLINKPKALKHPKAVTRRPPPATINLVSENAYNGTLSNNAIIEKYFCVESDRPPPCQAGDTVSDGKEQPLQANSSRLILQGRPKLDGDFVKGSSDWYFDLQILPDVSAVRSVDGVVVNYVYAVTGVFMAGPQVTEVISANVSDNATRVYYSKQSESLSVDAWLAIGEAKDLQSRIRLTTSCKKIEEEFQCGDVKISDVVDSFDIVVGNVSVVELGRSIASEQRNRRLTEGAFKLIVPDPGCDTYCPHCKDFVPSNCGAGGNTICYIAPHQRCLEFGTSCCGDIRGTCANCIDPPTGCYGSSNETIAVAVGGAAVGGSGEKGSRAPEAVASCEAVVLKSGRKFDSGLSVVTDDWSVIRVSSEGATVVGTSSVENGDDRARCIDRNTFGTYVVIDHVIHEVNGRHVSLPSVRLRGELGIQGAGSFVGKFEYDDVGDFFRASIVYSADELEDPHLLLEEIQSNLQIAWVSERRHALSAYVFLGGRGLGNKKKAEIILALPKCCDGCPPPPYVCQ